MAFPYTSPDASPYQRGPSDVLKAAGGDMSIFFIARVPLFNKFGSPEEQQIKGLNFETIATVYFPPPAWLYNPEYSTLQPKEDDENIGLAPFSLNVEEMEHTGSVQKEGTGSFLHTEWDTNHVTRKHVRSN